MVLAFAGLMLAGVCIYATAAAEGSGVSSLVVGLSHVPQPFVGGSKVRTPEALDSALVEALGQRLQVRARAQEIQDTSESALLSDDVPNVLLIAAANKRPVLQGTRHIELGYAVQPMAIMRTDTDIKRWEQLAGRTVCLSQGSLYVGEMARRYGATEILHKAPADSLLALRTGGCDAAVHDQTMLKELLRLPEWKKFSAKLTSHEKRELVFVAPADQPEFAKALTQTAKQWKKEGFLLSLNKQRVRDIAFEVYLDQAVTDCH